MAPIFPIGLILCSLACALLYAGSPNQQWLTKRYYSFKTALIISIGLLALASFCFAQVFSFTAAIFTSITLIMLLLSIIPLVTKWDKPLTAARGNKSTLSRELGSQPNPPKWWLKSIGAVVIGLPLGLFSSALITFIIFKDTPLDVKSQHVMWWITPIWLLLIAFIYFSHRPLRTLTLAGLIALIEFVALQVLF